jgi:7-cyano-7-deazaguanine synthase in queuosine biosynthesis
MAKRLIFFSGGVESTALLSFANYNDILLTVDILLDNRICHSINKDNCKKIANSYGFDLTHVDVVIPKTAKTDTFIHQINVFNGIAHNICTVDSSITHVWHGLNSLEPKSHAVKDYDRCINSWKLLQPNVFLEFPLKNYTKQQQWDSIPWDIKPYISSCVTYNNCGICKKCVEMMDNVI